MKISCIQMNMRLAAPDQNFDAAKRLIEKHVINLTVCVLPETWNTGFFPKEGLSALSDKDGERVRREIGGAAKESALT